MQESEGREGREERRKGERYKGEERVRYCSASRCDQKPIELTEMRGVKVKVEVERGTRIREERVDRERTIPVARDQQRETHSIV